MRDFLGRCSYMSPLPIELDFITKKEKPAPNRQTFPSIPKASQILSDSE